MGPTCRPFGHSKVLLGPWAACWCHLGAFLRARIAQTPAMFKRNLQITIRSPFRGQHARAPRAEGGLCIVFYILFSGVPWGGGGCLKGGGIRSPRTPLPKSQPEVGRISFPHAEPGVGGYRSAQIPYHCIDALQPNEQARVKPLCCVLA